MSDSRAEDTLAKEVWNTAFDLKELAVHLCKAMQRARLGHRGWVLARYWIVSEVSMALEGTGFALVDSTPGKSFEHYPDAYDRRVPRRESKLREHVLPLREALKPFVDGQPIEVTDEHGHDVEDYERAKRALTTTEHA